MRSASVISVLAAAALAACDTADRHQAVAATHTSTTTASITMPKAGLIPGTPDGDLGAWVSNIRAGLAEVRKLAATDATAAQRKALDLYVTRQEYAEMYYGIDGRARATEELAQAIETAEERFHDLMKLLGTPKPATDAVVAAVQALDEQQAAVVKLWRKSGAKLDRSATQ